MPPCAGWIMPAMLTDQQGFNVVVPELKRTQCTMTRKTRGARGMTPHKVTLIRPEPTLPGRQRLPARTIPNKIYP